MPDELDDLLDQMASETDQASALKGRFRDTANVDPEAYAKHIRTAAVNGVAPSVVASNPQPFETEAKATEYSPELVQEVTPSLAAWLVEHEDNVPVSRDDIPTLQKVEESARDRALKAEEQRVAEDNKRRGAGVYMGLGASALGGIGTLASTIKDAQAATIRATVGNVFGKGAVETLKTVGKVNPLQWAIEGLDLGGKKLSGWAKQHEYETENLVVKDPKTGQEFLNLGAANPSNPKGLMNAAKIIAGELAPTAATIGLAVATGGAGAAGAAPKAGRLLALAQRIGQYAVSAPGLLEVGRTVQGQYQNGVQFLMSKDPTLSQEDAEIKAAHGALLAGLLSGPTGAAMEGKILEDLMIKVAKAPGAQSIIKKWGSKLLSLGITGAKEGAQEVVQGFAEDLADWVTINPDKTLVQVAGNAIQNLTGGVAMGAGMRIAIPGGHGPDKPVGDIQDLVDAAKESKLLKRSPEKFREATGSMLQGETTLIEPTAFMEYFQSQGLDPYVMAEKVGVKNLDEALASGNPLIMETADYLTQLAVEHHEGLAPDLRTSIGEWTPRMAEENAAALEAAQAEMVQAQKAIESTKELSLKEQIREDLVKKFDPLFEPSTAGTYADAFANILATLEVRSGQDLSKWREGLTVSRPMEGERGMSIQDVMENRLKANAAPESPDALYQVDSLEPSQIKAQAKDIFEAKTASQEYDNLPDSQGGKVLDVDLARQLDTNYQQDPLLVTSLHHEAVSNFMKRKFIERMAQPVTVEGEYVEFLAGGGGSGKNTAAKQLNLGDQAHTVWNGALSNYDSAKSMIEDALASGRRVGIDFIYRPVEKAVEGNIVRAHEEEGRAVPLKVLADAHKGAIETVKRLLSEYEGNGLVSFNVVDNSGTREDMTLVPQNELMSFMESHSYDEGIYKTVEETYNRLKGAGYEFQGQRKPVERRVAQAVEGKTLDRRRASDAGAGGPRGVAVRAGEEGRLTGQTLFQQGINPDEARMSEASFLAWEEEIKAIQLGDTHEGKRGFIQWGANYQTHVGLFATANLSTAIHEIGGHFAFEILADLAQQEGVPQQIKDDYQGFLEASGYGTHDNKLAMQAEAKAIDTKARVEGRELTSVEAARIRELAKPHETFARLSEAYVMEGNAPSEELRGAFARMKEWMKLIYRQLKNLGVKLSPEIRAAFDRMYATDEAIAQAREQTKETRKLIAKPEDVGWDQATFDLYQKTIAKAQERAAVAVEQKLIAEAQRQHEDWYKAERESIRADVETGVDSRKDFKDLKALQRGQLEDGTPMKLDRAQIVALIGEKETQAISRSKGAVYVKEGGVDIDSAAEIMGYESGRQLVETLTRLPKRAELIENLTDEIMKAKHGDMATDGTLADEAVLAVHQKADEEVLVLELKALKAKARSVAPFLRKQYKDLREEQRQNLKDVETLARERIGNIKAEQRQQSKDRAEMERAQHQMAREDERAIRKEANAAMDVPPLATFRAAAVELINSQKIMDIQPNRYLTTGRQESRKAFEAMGKQDFAAAAQAKKNELMNHFLYLEAVKARALAEKQAGKARDLAKTPAQQRIGKAKGDFLNQLNAILDQYEFAKIPLKDILAREKGREEWVNSQLAANGGEGNGIVMPDPILFNEIPKNYKELTPPELSAVMDLLNNIQAVARNQYRYTLGNEEAELEAEKAQFISTAYANNKVKKVRRRGAYEGFWDKRIRQLRGIDAEMTKMEWLIDQLDGGDINGPARRNIKKPIDDASANRNALMKDVFSKIRTAFEARPKAERQGEIQEMVGIRLPGMSEDLNRLQLISFWLNMGNAENEKVAMEGEGLQNVEGIKIVEDMRKAMRPSDWKFVQDVWDSLESTKEGLFQVEKQMTGLEPVAKTLTPFDVKMEDGTVIHMRGGYYPLRADSVLDAKGELMEDPFKHLSVGSMAPSTKTSAAQKVTGATYRLLLDYRSILGPHLKSVVTRITMGETIRNVSRFTADEDVRRALQETLNEEEAKQFKPWLQDMANTETVDEGPVMRWLMKRRSAMTTAVLIGNLGSLLIQGSDVVKPAMEILNWNPTKFFGVPGFAKAYFDVITNRSEMVKFIKDLSPNEMRFRADNFQRDLREMEEARGALGEGNARVSQFLGQGFMVMDSLTSFPAWLAKYRQGMDEHGNEAQAVMEADRMVARRLQAGENRNMSQMFRRPGASKLFTTFMGDANTLYGIVASSVKSGNPARMTSALMAVVLSQMIGQMLKNRGPEDDEDWLPWMGEQTMKGVAGVVPVVSDLMDVGINTIIKGRKADLRNPVISALVKPFEALGSINKAMAGEKDPEEALIDALDAAGSWTGIPGTAQILRTWKYVHHVAEGEQQPESIPEALAGATLGPKPKKK